MTRWRIILIAGLLLACLGSSATLYQASGRGCRNPAFLTLPARSFTYPLPDFDAIIAVTGGLPGSHADWDGEAFEFPHYLHLSPVTAWRITSVYLSTDEPLQQRLLDDDPTYLLSLEMEVDYANGTTGVLRWSRWQFGLLLCPFAVPYGDGPPWAIERLD